MAGALSWGWHCKTESTSVTPGAGWVYPSGQGQAMHKDAHGLVATGFMISDTADQNVLK